MSTVKSKVALVAGASKDAGASCETPRGAMVMAAGECHAV